MSLHLDQLNGWSVLAVRVIPSNLHSCYGIIEYFRNGVSSNLTLSYADIIFPEERLSCIIGRDTKFLLAVDERAAAGCCIATFSTEPMRSEVLFVHAIRSQETTLQALLDNVLSFLKSRRAPDLEVKYVEGLHSTQLHGVLSELDFDEKARSRMLLEASKQKQLDETADGGFKFRVTDSLINWRAAYLAATHEKSFEQAKKIVCSETPYGTMQEDDLVRLIAYSDKLPVGAIGYSVCRNIGYVDRLSVLPICRDRNLLAKRLLIEAIKRIRNRKCDHVIMDVEKDLVTIDMLRELGFESVGKVSYFHRVVTSRLGAESNPA